jgi:hypothetical protein
VPAGCLLAALLLPPPRPRPTRSRAALRCDRNARRLSLLRITSLPAPAPARARNARIRARAQRTQGNFKGATYTDKTAATPTELIAPSDEILISKETDSVYKGVSGEVRLLDSGKGTSLAIQCNQGWRDTVVWNPYGNEGRRAPAPARLAATRASTRAKSAPPLSPCVVMMPSVRSPKRALASAINRCSRSLSRARVWRGCMLSPRPAPAHRPRTRVACFGAGMGFDSFVCAEAAVAAAPFTLQPASEWTGLMDLVSTKL